MAFVDNDCRVVFVANHGTGALERQIKVIRYQTHNVPVCHRVHMIVELCIQRHIETCVVIFDSAVVFAAVHPVITSRHHIGIQNGNKWIAGRTIARKPITIPIRMVHKIARCIEQCAYILQRFLIVPVRICNAVSINMPTGIWIKAFTWLFPNCRRWLKHCCRNHRQQHHRRQQNAENATPCWMLLHVHFSSLLFELLVSAFLLYHKKKCLSSTSFCEISRKTKQVVSHFSLILQGISCFFKTKCSNMNFKNKKIFL